MDTAWLGGLIFLAIVLTGGAVVAVLTLGHWLLLAVFVGLVVARIASSITSHKSVEAPPPDRPSVS